MRTAITIVAGLALWIGSPWALASDDGPRITPDQAVERLEDGNARYEADKATHPDTNAQRRRETGETGQYPFVTFLSCSDSRVPVELIFDQGVGDVFVVRVAGNVCGVHEAGSIEYGVDHLGTPLLVVLGHTQCGAVTAVTMGAEVHGNIRPLVQGIVPAVAKAQKEHPESHGKDLVPAAIQANVWQAMDDLFKNSPVIRKRVAEGKLKVVGAVYHLTSGRVEWLGEHPEKSRLLSYQGGGEQHESHPAAPPEAKHDEHSQTGDSAPPL